MIPLGRRAALSGLALTAAGRKATAETALPLQPRLGVYRGAGCDGRPRIDHFSAWLGRRPGWAVDFVDYSRDWPLFLDSARWILGCWRGAPYRLSLAVPMLPTMAGGDLRAGADGHFDAHFRELGTMLHQTQTVIRLGWEFNGDWMPWAAARDPAAFVAFWRRAVEAMRAAAGPGLQFEWAPSLGRNAIDPSRVYPGDDVVDLIGLSAYNQSWTVPQNAASLRWLELRHRPNGLQWHRDFAAARGKPRSFPEWGTGSRPDPHGGEDDPHFIEAMADWMAPPDVVYSGYWDYQAYDYDGQLSEGRYPKAGEAFRRRFGG